MYKIKLEKFEGPLDLLLQLIEEEELDISEVSLAQVTEQYIAYLNSVPDILPEELADFLVVAAKLLYIKSKILIPQLEIEDEEEGDLEKQLKIYRIFHLAGKGIEKIIARNRFSYIREVKGAKVIDPIFTPPKGLATNTLKEIFIEVLKKIEPIVNLPQEVMEKTVSIQEKISQIQEAVQRGISLNFHTLLKSAASKTEIIVTFLALLELVKQQVIVVMQQDAFADIEINNYQEVDQLN